MSFIGILTDHKNEIYLKRELENSPDNETFFLSEKTIDNVRNIKFDTFLLGKKIEESSEIIRSIVQKASYVIMNSDIKENVSLLDNLDLMLITYGYHSKATVTISSTEENGVMLCLQRSIVNKYGEEIEPQEFEIQTDEKVSDYAVMELASLKLIYQKNDKK